MLLQFRYYVSNDRSGFTCFAILRYYRYLFNIIKRMISSLELI